MRGGSSAVLDDTYVCAALHAFRRTTTWRGRERERENGYIRHLEGLGPYRYQQVE